MMLCFIVQYDFLEINIEGNLPRTYTLLKMEKLQDYTVRDYHDY